MQLKIPSASQHFAIFRITLGTYLAIHFAMLIPYASELFSSYGVISDPFLLPSKGIFPNVLGIYGWDYPTVSSGLLYLLTALSICFALGIRRRIISFTLWFGWACLFNRNIFIANPGLPMVGWLLLACTVIPSGESWAYGSRELPDWKIPPIIYWGAWAIMAAGYTASGIHKLGSPSWVDGTSIARLLVNPLARDSILREILIGMPWLTKFATLSSLALEVLFLPLALIPKFRPFVWLAMTSLHFGILAVVNFADLTLGVLMMHLFTVDYRWLSCFTRRTTSEP